MNSELTNFPSIIISRYPKNIPDKTVNDKGKVKYNNSFFSLGFKKSWGYFKKFNLFFAKIKNNINPARKLNDSAKMIRAKRILVDQPEDKAKRIANGTKINLKHWKRISLNKEYLKLFIAIKEVSMKDKNALKGI